MFTVNTYFSEILPQFFLHPSFLFFQILWIIPQKAVRWILVLIALGISGSVLAMTFWPAVREDNRRVSMATIVTIVMLHMLLSVGCLVWSHF